MPRPTAMSRNRVPQHLRTLMNQHRIGENALSRATGVPQSTIHRVLNEPGLEARDSTLHPLATYFGITVEQLRRGTTAAQQTHKHTQREATVKRAPPPIPAYEVRASEGQDDLDPESEVSIAEVDIAVSGGPGAWLPEYAETRYRMVYQRSWFEQVGAKPEHVRTMKVIGDSMEPLLYPGDRIVVNFADTRIVNRGVYVFAAGSVDPDIRVKRLFWTVDGRLRIVSDNPDKTLYPDEFLAQGELEHIHILGRVIDKSGRGGL